MSMKTLIAAAFASLVTAYPNDLKRADNNPFAPSFTYNIGPHPTNDPDRPNGYIAPTENDVRSPCPALNTLANHGFLPRDGRNISRVQVQEAFVNGFNVGFSTTEVPKENLFNVCEFATAHYCETADLNVLDTPHTFEHDHSFSREDFMQAYGGAPTDNHDFNGTIFQSSLNVLQGTQHMNFQQMNEVRNQRQALSSISDKPGWFTLAQDVQETEAGFIFAIMKDFNIPDYLTNPQVRVEWWNFWFAYESFPTPLGWMRPTVQIEQSFVSSCSSAIRTAQSLTSTPTPYATSFFRREVDTQPTAAADNAANPTVGDIAPATAAPTGAGSAASAVPARPTIPNAYAELVLPSMWSSVSNAIQSDFMASENAPQPTA